MKYILLLLSSLVALGSVLAFDTPSTYSPTAADQALVQGLEPQIDALYAADPDRVQGITQKLLAISTAFASNTREYFVLRELYVYMNEIMNDTTGDDDLLNTLNALFGDEPAAPEPAVVSAPAPAVVSTATPVATSNMAEYMTYSDAALNSALAANKRVIINFRAKRCPNCTAAFHNINENLADLPSDVVILDADFDTSTELKAKHGVTRQTTFVFLDQN